MTYRTALHTLVATLLLVFVAACDSESSSGKDTGGTDTALSQKAAKSDDGQPAANGGSDAPKGRPEATSKGGTVTEKPPLNIDSLLTPKDIGKMTPKGNTFSAEDLSGVSASPSFNARRFAPSGGGFGAALEVWAFDEESGAVSRYESLKKQYLNVEDPPKAATKLVDRAFLSNRGGIRQMVFHLQSPPRVVAVSCGETVCKENDGLLEVVEKVVERLREQN